MSERTVVLVEFPIERTPTKAETMKMLKDSYGEAKKIIGPGKVLGIVNVAIGQRKSDQATCMMVRLAVDCPESVQLAAMQ